LLCITVLEKIVLNKYQLLSLDLQGWRAEAYAKFCGIYLLPKLGDSKIAQFRFFKGLLPCSPVKLDVGLVSK